LQEGFDWACVESSSIGLDQGRLRCVRMEAAAYTNLSRDHLDYHKTMEAYVRAKQRLASQPGLKHVVVNQDDEQAVAFGEVARSMGIPVTSVGESKGARYRIEQLTVDQQALSFVLNGMTIQTHLVGQFNAHNLAMAAAVLCECGVRKFQELVPYFSELTAAPGRMQLVHRSPAVVVDYAHTPDALEKALQALVPMTQADHSKGHLRVLFGCGGDRDPGKRPLMTKVAVKHADWIYLTSDNPRSEKADNIIKDMLKGVEAQEEHKVVCEVDRARAIERCLSESQAHDVILLAGKGHETSQLIGKTVFPHSDLECVQNFYLSRGQA
ncbi:MAG: UDP-N-acetylmuramoyl-L-alanyl-D-glutamate--2,6-diaminopimelate ligase, partial [Limnobacter sp.]|nr:UDP-N-acetylmuramoyl-L-alanyl-D-glutamate--2,6-diaminopimelate ligase [Limnobacter sp.]